jgi:hypothetical protein
MPSRYNSVALISGFKWTLCALCALGYFHVLRFLGYPDLHWLVPLSFLAAVRDVVVAADWITDVRRLLSQPRD